MYMPTCCRLRSTPLAARRQTTPTSWTCPAARLPAAVSAQGMGPLLEATGWLPTWMGLGTPYWHPLEMTGRRFAPTCCRLRSTLLLAARRWTTLPPWTRPAAHLHAATSAPGTGPPLEATGRRSTSTRCPPRSAPCLAFSLWTTLFGDRWTVASIPATAFFLGLGTPYWHPLGMTGRRLASTCCRLRSSPCQAIRLLSTSPSGRHLGLPRRHARRRGRHAASECQVPPRSAGRPCFRVRPVSPSLHACLRLHGRRAPRALRRRVALLVPPLPRCCP